MRMRTTIRTTAIHAPMIPHISAFDSPGEPRAPASGSPGVPVVVPVVGVVVGGMAKNNKKMNHDVVSWKSGSDPNSFMDNTMLFLSPQDTRKS